MMQLATESGDMDLTARRIFRLSITTAMSLACGYAFQLQVPYLAPIFGVLLTVDPAPPLGPAKLLALLVLIPVALSAGLLLIPLLEYYPLSAILLVGLGLYASFYLSWNRGKELLGTFLATGITLVSIAGSVSSVLATAVIESLVAGIAIAILCQWVIYPFFPEDQVAAEKNRDSSTTRDPSPWIAIRGALIVIPSYLVVLTNPGMYLPLVLKSITLGQQGSLVDVKSAGRELLGATILGGGYAILFWWLLGLSVNLWLFFCWMLLFSTYFASKIYRLLPSRFSPSFWQNVTTTLLILLGSAVMDSENGKDVYAAFFTRISLFLLVTLYAWLAVYLLERKLGRHRSSHEVMESSTC